MREILWPDPSAPISEVFSVRESSGVLVFAPLIEGETPSAGVEALAPDGTWLAFRLQGQAINQFEQLGISPSILSRARRSCISENRGSILSPSPPGYDFHRSPAPAPAPALDQGDEIVKEALNYEKNACYQDNSARG